jgi:hypothetical protein
MTIGIFAAASTAVYWGQRHNFWSLGFDRLAYDATFCAYFALCISLKFKFSNSFSKFLAKFTNVSIPILLLISLNRTDFVFLIWLYAFFVIKSRVNLSIVLKTLVATMILLIIGLTDLTWAFFNQFPQFKSRYSDSFIQLLPQIFAYDTAINDQSLIVRRLHGEMALEAFRTNALFGKGVLPTNTYYDHFYGSFAVLGLIGFSLVVYFIFRLKKDVTTGQFDKDLAQAIFLFLSLLIPASFIINWTSSKSLWIVCLSIIALNASNNGFELKRYIEMSDRNIDS